MRSPWCRLRGHRFVFDEYDPVTKTHSLRCLRCGLNGWPNIYVGHRPRGLMVDT